MSVLIFTEGGSEMGYGHLSRCSSLYDELASRGIQVEMIVYGDVKILEMLKEKRATVANWLSPDFLDAQIKESDYCIVDSYLASEALCQLISDRAKKTMYIDDGGRINYPQGMVVNPSLNAKAIDYPSHEGTTYLLGPEHIILRKPFIDVNRESIALHVREVLITLGGSDNQNLMNKLVNEICVNYPSIQFNVVTGRSAEHDEELFDLKNIRLFQNLSAEEMKDLMLRSDLAISAAGQTIYELLATQTVFIPIQTIKNQQYISAALKEFGFVASIIEKEDPQLLEHIKREFEQALDYHFRLNMAHKYRGVVDGVGSKRIIDTLISNSADHPYFLRKIKEKDRLAVYQLSNADYVRKYSRSTEKISWAQHKAWFQNVLESKNPVFYVVTDTSDTFLGQVRYQLEGQTAIVSISLSPSVMGKGLSSHFLNTSMKFFFVDRNEVTSITAFISSENKASRRLFEKAGFYLLEDDHGMLKYVYEKK